MTKPQEPNMLAETEAEASYQADLYDQACRLLEKMTSAMTSATRQRFFDYIKRKEADPCR